LRPLTKGLFDAPREAEAVDRPHGFERAQDQEFEGA